MGWGGVSGVSRMGWGGVSGVSGVSEVSRGRRGEVHWRRAIQEYAEHLQVLEELEVVDRLGRFLHDEIGQLEEGREVARLRELEHRHLPPAGSNARQAHAAKTHSGTASPSRNCPPMTKPRVLIGAQRSVIAGATG